MAEEKKTQKAKTSKSKKDDNAKIQEKLSELEKNLADEKDKYLRTLAEYDNYRRRTKEEKQNLFTEAKADVFGELLPILDDFERAEGAENVSYEDYKTGTEMIFSKLKKALEKAGAECYGESGDSFDPNIHTAVMHVEDESFKAEEIVEVFQKGYKIGDKVIRRAMVKVAN
ncbi:MAG: nucleotide exchange factor GrpE [Candidatus Fimenecus sp.]